MDSPSLTPVETITDPELKSLADSAATYLSNQSWCRSIQSSYLGYAVPAVLGVFLVRIVPARAGVDDMLWVVVGDLPPAYLVCEGNPTWLEALEGYVFEMERWVAAVRSGGPFEDVIPVRVERTLEHADKLAGRLRFIRDEILAFEDDTTAGEA